MIVHFPTRDHAIAVLTKAGFIEIGFCLYTKPSEVSANGYLPAVTASIHPVIGGSYVMVAYSENQE